MGVTLASRNLAQVSINLTDFEQTPMHLVFETVRREAERYGVSVVGSEIVGLIPKKALEDAAECAAAFLAQNPHRVLVGQARRDALENLAIARDGFGALVAITGNPARAASAMA